MTGARVLVTDGHLRSALSVVRSLGRAGYQVHVCSPRARSLAGASRYASTETQIADPLGNQTLFLNDVKRLATALSIDVLLPMSEEALLVLLPAHSSLPTIPFADVEAFKNASDKKLVMELAREFGILTPEQIVINEKPIRSQPWGSLHFPVVIKPARSVAGTGAEQIKTGVSYAHNELELDAALRALPSAAYPVLLQRRIEGHGTGIFLLIWNGRLIAQFAHQRLREKPPSGGLSVCSTSIEADESLVSRSYSLLSKLRWRGPAMVEFKEDGRTGDRYLMEINGRFWGSLQLAVDSGVDFPKLLVEAALGGVVNPVSTYKLGAVTRWWWGEVDHLIARLRNDFRDYNLGSRAAAVRRFFYPERGARNEVLRLDDPRPFVRETIDWFQRR